MCNVLRTPIKVKRKPVTIFSENNRSIGGWFAFPIPRMEPNPPRMKASQRQLWCPFCNEWEVFEKEEIGRWHCTGVCGWANTAEWYVRTYNQLWHEE